MLQKFLERVELKQNISIIVKTNIFVTSSSITTSKEFLSINEKCIFKKIRININFKLIDDLIYYIKNDTRRLYFFVTIKKKVFRLTYDENAHFNIHRCYNRIMKTFYIFKLSKKIRRYIEHYFNCQLT